MAGQTTRFNRLLHPAWKSGEFKRRELRRFFYFRRRHFTRPAKRCQCGLNLGVQRIELGDQLVVARVESINQFTRC